MNRKLKNAVWAVSLSLALVLSQASPAWAGSRTATVRVSCTVLPMIEMSSNAAVLSNQRLASTEEFRAIGGRGMKLISYTAL